MSDEAGMPNTIELATELTIAWLSNPNTRAGADDVPAFLKSMHAAVGELATPAATEATEEAGVAPEHAPAVSVRKSLASKDHIVSLIDGKTYKTLRRHLSRHGLTPDEYRQRYGLKADYPMVAPNYSEHRRAMAHKIGLGAKRPAAKAQEPALPEEAATKPAPKRRVKPKAAAAGTPAS